MGVPGLRSTEGPVRTGVVPPRPGTFQRTEGHDGGFVTDPFLLRKGSYLLHADGRDAIVPIEGPCDREQRDRITAGL